MKDHIKQLKELNACSDAVEWAEQFDDLQSAWDACQRGDWMLWLIPRVLDIKQDDPNHRKLGLARCKCGRLAFLPYAADAAALRQCTELVRQYFPTAPTKEPT